MQPEKLNLQDTSRRRDGQLSCQERAHTDNEASLSPGSLESKPSVYKGSEVCNKPIWNLVGLTLLTNPYSDTRVQQSKTTEDWFGSR